MTQKELDPLKDDFRKFLWLVWRTVLGVDPTPVQYDIAKYLQHAPPRRLVQGFRGMGKSWITASYVVWRLYCNPALNILVVSASERLANDFSTFCHQIISTAPQLAHLKPREGQRDAKISFDVGPAPQSKDPSVFSIGLTGQITGRRADEIIPDDIETPENTQTQLMREKVAEKIKEFEAIIKPGGRITFLGTPHCADTIYKVLVEQRGYAKRVWPIFYPDAKTAEKTYGPFLAPWIVEQVKAQPFLVGRSVEPTRFSEVDLEDRKRAIGRSTFALQYLLDTSPGDYNRYPLKLADAIFLRIDHHLGPVKVTWANHPDLQVTTDLNVGLSGDCMFRPMFVSKEEPQPYEGSVLFIDPAGRGKDETAYAVVKHLLGMLFVTQWGGLRGGYTDENLGFLAKMAKDEKVNHVLVESNFGDGMFGKLLEPHLKRHHPVTVEEVRSTKAKEARIIDTLEPVLNQHRLVFDEALIDKDYHSVADYDGTDRIYYRGLYQLTHLTRDKGSLAKDDRIDALAGAVQYWLEAMSLVQEEAQANLKAQRVDEEIEAFLTSWNTQHSPQPSADWTSITDLAG